MVVFEQVNKSYANGKQALIDVDFALKQGEIAFLTGHSGAGKSSLLKLIAGIEQPTSGRICVGDQDISHIRRRHIPALRQSMGLIFQDPSLLKDRNIFDNIALPLVITGYHQAEMVKRVRAALEKVGLSGKEHMFPSELSGGEQQRVGIARAIVHKPSILLADEPTGNLDPELAAEIMYLFEQFNNVGVTVLIASHDLALIARMHHRILRLHHGKLLS
jgi:cell division transport system ATP-binding protein